MWRSPFVFSLLLSALGSTLHAQSTPPVGATLRWQEGDRELVRGTLIAAPELGASLRVVREGTRDTVLVARGTPALAWRSRGSQKLMGGAMGLFLGAGIGYVIGDAAEGDCEGFCLFEGVGRSIGAGVGAGIGLVAGALVFPGERWTALGDGAPAGLLLAPGRVGIRVAF